MGRELVNRNLIEDIIPKKLTIGIIEADGWVSAIQIPALCFDKHHWNEHDVRMILHNHSDRVIRNRIMEKDGSVLNKQEVIDRIVSMAAGQARRDGSEWLFLLRHQQVNPPFITKPFWVWFRIFTGSRNNDGNVTLDMPKPFLTDNAEITTVSENTVQETEQAVVQIEDVENEKALEKVIIPLIVAGKKAASSAYADRYKMVPSEQQINDAKTFSDMHRPLRAVYGDELIRRLITKHRDDPEVLEALKNDGY